MDEPVKVCLESEPPLCVTLPFGIALFGIAAYVIWQVVNGDKKNGNNEQQVSRKTSKEAK